VVIIPTNRYHERETRVSDDGNQKDDDGCGCGCGGFTLGGFIAILLSWTTNHSVLYALVHGLLGWFYVIYWLLFNSSNSGDIPW
jgi:hypothetical protein